MQRNGKEIKKIQYQYENEEYIILNRCPHCNLEIYPTTDNVYTLENNSNEINVISLTCPSCKKDYFIFNDLHNEGNNEKFLFSLPKYRFNENSLIENTSIKFQNIYIQSINCNLQGYSDMAFFGYIKALEILLKDIAILEHPESEDIILFCNVIECLEQFHATNIHLFSKKLLEVLKNDYLHYQKTDDLDMYTELVKDCINYFLLYFELLLKTLHDRKNLEN